MNTLNSYGYNDGDNSLLSLKMKQQAIDNAQDKKIDNLSKQSGGDVLEIRPDTQNVGEHTELTKEQAVEILNISENDFDKLMSGKIEQVIFVLTDGTEIIERCRINVFYYSFIRDGDDFQQTVVANQFIMSEKMKFGFTCGLNGGLYDVVINAVG